MIRRYILILSILLLFTVLSKGQEKYDFTWVFSQNSSLTQGNEASILSFKNGKVSIDSINIDNQMGLNNSSFSNGLGDLVLYSNACEIYDSTYQVVENGSGINPGEVHDNWCDIGEYPANANSLFLEDPNGLGVYFVHKNIVNTQFDVTRPDLMYSFVDKDDLEVSEKNIKIDSFRNKISGYMEAIRHDNGKDWWLVDFTVTQDSGLILKFLLDDSGFSLIEKEKYTNQSSLERECSSGGQACFSPDGTKYAKFCAYSGLDVFDFNRATCEFTNYRNITPSQITDQGVSGVAFSPNGRFVYVSDRVSLVQVDLETNDPTSVVERIDTYDNYLDPLPTSFAWMQIGPDCRIYMTSTNGIKSLHVINNPDEKGKDCDFVQRGLKLRSPNSVGSLPNHPVFRFDGEEVCDSTITNVFDVPIEVTYDLEVFPNPTLDEITVNIPGNINKGILTIKSISGQQLYKQEIKQTRQVDLSLDGYQNSVYVVELISNSQVFVGKIIKVD